MIWKSVFIFSFSLAVCSAMKGQQVQIKDLNYNAYPNPSLLKMDTVQSKLLVLSILEDQVNIQIFSADSFLKMKEVNIPMQLGENERVADVSLLNDKNIGILLKTFTSNKIYIKSIEVSAPGLIPKPNVLIEMENRNVELVISEKNPRKSVNNQVHIECSPNKKFFSVINRQQIVCTSDSKDLEIYNFDQKLQSKGKYLESNCSYKDIHIFNNGKIVMTKSQQGKIILNVFQPYFKSKIYHYTFPEIVIRPFLELSERKDTFDQQVQFYFDDAEFKTYAFIKGFVNNNYISHAGLFIYDVAQNKELLSKKNVHETKDFVKYSIAHRDNLAAYNFEYPMHLKLKHIRKLVDGSYEVVGDYMSYGRMPLGDDFAGMAKSEASYLIHLDAFGRLLGTKILLHRQSIISYPNNKDSQSTYLVDLDRVDKRVGQIYMYNDTCNYIVHNNDKKAFYSADRLYRFTYFGTDGSVALVKFSNATRSKSRLTELDDYTLLPMQSKFYISSEEVICYAYENKKVKLLALSLDKP